MMFYTHKYKFPSEKKAVWGYSVQNLYAVCVSLRVASLISFNIIKNEVQTSKQRNQQLCAVPSASGCSK